MKNKNISISSFQKCAMQNSLTHNPPQLITNASQSQVQEFLPFQSNHEAHLNIKKKKNTLFVCQVRIKSRQYNDGGVLLGTNEQVALY